MFIYNYVELGITVTVTFGKGFSVPLTDDPVVTLFINAFVLFSISVVLFSITVVLFSTVVGTDVGTGVSIIVGAAITSFLGADKSAWWFYSIGLLVGFVLYTVIGIWGIKEGITEKLRDSGLLNKPN